MNLCLYEDPAVSSFGPHALLRPVFALRCGIFSLLEKLVRAFPQSPLVFCVRPELEDLTRVLYPAARVEDPPEEETLFVNGRLCMTDDEVLHFLAAAPTEASYVAGGVLFAAKVKPGRVAHAIRHLRAGDPETAFQDVRFPAEVNAFLARSVADLIRWSPRQIVQDFRYAFQAGTVRGTIDPGAHVIRPEAIHVARGARVAPGAVLNAEGGPILIQENATVEPLAYVEGPAVIGERSLIKVGAKIRGGTSIGPVCKVGGEVEASVFQGYSNKQHDGFLGHSFVGEWVNLGANTNNSDLKNNYSDVRFFRSAKDYLDGRGEPSGQKLLGLSIGDFTKTGISTSFPTGAVVGIGSNLYGTELWPAYTPSFVWGQPGRLVEHRIDDMVETAARAMERRQAELTVELDSRIRQA
ncbi:MAG TPA: putative sugar nucleotidyl transferase, partial [Candidatus Eisenbacteria bacterium]|nr:putative sugar nucleotidyl transferase [Candidatus Eisenbacteria bacterium]